MAGSCTMVVSHTARASYAVLEYKVAKQDECPISVGTDSEQIR